MFIFLGALTNFAISLMTWLSSKQTVYSYPSENAAEFEHMFQLILPLAVWVAQYYLYMK